eukprot:jgi/Botrbrau1/9444/Bobra.0252s0067.1
MMRHQRHVALCEGDEALPIFKKRPAGDENVMLDGSMAPNLKPHQWEGLEFLWETIVLDNNQGGDEEEDRGGCILAHSMGLGKSLQVIAFLHTYHAYWPEERSLLVAPANVVANWKQEFDKWLPERGDEQGLTLSKVFVFKEKMDIFTWSNTPSGVLIISYDTFRSNIGVRKQSQGKERSAYLVGEVIPNAELDQVQQSIRDLLCSADIVVADEAHEIKNPKGLRSLAMNQVKTFKRIGLTGTPLQNHLPELYTMMEWIRPGYLPPREEFHKIFEKAVERGMHRDAEYRDKKAMYKQISALHSSLEHIVHRRGPELLRKELPPKQEHIILFRLSPVQDAVYTAFTQVLARRDLFRDRMMLQLLCSDPTAFLDNLQEVADGRLQHLSTGGDDFVGAPNFHDPSVPCGVDIVEAAPMGGPAFGKPGALQRTFGSLSPQQAQMLLDIADRFEECGHDGHQSGIQWFLTGMLHRCHIKKEKVVVFSEFLHSLDSAEGVLDEMGFKKNVSYIRMDGKTIGKKRQENINRFNSDPQLKVMLMSTRAGGVGTNLTAASCMIVMDEPWNPVHNTQAIARIFRLGQQKPTIVYRLMAKNTMEHRVYRRNVDKEGLFLRVVDSKTVKGLNANDDRELYLYESPRPMKKEEIQTIIEAQEASTPGDENLVDILKEDMEAQYSWIAGLENHQENLPEDPEQMLTEQQRIEAAAEFAAVCNHFGDGRDGVRRNPTRLVKRLRKAVNCEDWDQLVLSKQAEAQQHRHLSDYQNPVGLATHMEAEAEHMQHLNPCMPSFGPPCAQQGTPAAAAQPQAPQSPSLDKGTAPASSPTSPERSRDSGSCSGSPSLSAGEDGGVQPPDSPGSVMSKENSVSISPMTARGDQSRALSVGKTTSVSISPITAKGGRSRGSGGGKETSVSISPMTARGDQSRALSGGKTTSVSISPLTAREGCSRGSGGGKKASISISPMTKRGNCDSLSGSATSASSSEGEGDDAMSDGSQSQSVSEEQGDEAASDSQASPPGSRRPQVAGPPGKAEANMPQRGPLQTTPAAPAPTPKRSSPKKGAGKTPGVPVRVSPRGAGRQNQAPTSGPPKGGGTGGRGPPKATPGGAGRIPLSPLSPAQGDSSRNRPKPQSGDPAKGPAKGASNAAQAKRPLPDSVPTTQAKKSRK